MELGLLLLEGVCVLVRLTLTVRPWPYHTCAKAGRPYLGQNGQVPESNEIMASKLVFRKSGVSMTYSHGLSAHWIILQIHCSLCVRACVCARAQVPMLNQGFTYFLTLELCKVLPLVGWRNAAGVMKPQWETAVKTKKTRPHFLDCRCSELP